MARSVRIVQKPVSVHYDERVTERVTSTPSPMTPIPPRASAHPQDSIKARPLHVRRAMISSDLDEVDLTRIPTLPERARLRSWMQPAQVSASLPLAIDEIDTLAPVTQSRPGTSHVLPSSEPDVTTAITLPQRQLQSDVTTATTQPQERLQPDVTMATTQPQERLLPDLTAVPTLPQWRLRSDVDGVQERASLRTVLSWPLDRLRWWLLLPGRIEFLLWLSGTVLLLCITSVFAFFMAASLNFVYPSTAEVSLSGAPGTTVCGTVGARAGAAKSCVSIVTAAGLKVAMLNGALQVDDATLQLHGQGFSAGGEVTFTHDNGQPCEPGMVQADARGAFSAILRMDGVHDWPVGHHQVFIVDVESRRSVSLNLLLTHAPLPHATAPASPTPTAAGATPTVGASDAPDHGHGKGGNGGSAPGAPGNGSPHGAAPPPWAGRGPASPAKTPPAVHPTAVPPPTPSPVVPDPSPTVPSVPPPTPTLPVSSATATPQTPRGTPTPVAPSSAVPGASVQARLFVLVQPAAIAALPIPMLWLLLVAYLLVTVLLGLAGIRLQRQRRRS